MISWWSRYQKRRLFKRLSRHRFRADLSRITPEACTIGSDIEFVEWAVVERVFGMGAE